LTMYQNNSFTWFSQEELEKQFFYGLVKKS
jgi:hypothetical protein